MQPNVAGFSRMVRGHVLNKETIEFATVPTDTVPLLLITVDTEAEFDWSRPFSRKNTQVRSIVELHRAQDIFDRHGIRPTYAVDYAVATDGTAIRVLRDFLEDGTCHIGSHLNPWINPPFEETTSAYNSYPGNLPRDLEGPKLACLSEVIAENFGIRPQIYKAGRFGIGPNTAEILAGSAYRVDLSVVPHTSFSGDGGPDFSGFDPRPFWFSRERKLLEIPVSCGFCGALAALGPTLFPKAAGVGGMKMRLPGICARLGLLERIRLTPEGVDFTALRRLTRSLLAQGVRIFSFTFHSPSLGIGNTPYVCDHDELRTLLRTTDQYIAYFTSELGGKPVGPLELYRLLTEAKSSAPRHAADPSKAAKILGPRSCSPA